MKILKSNPSFIIDSLQTSPQSTNDLIPYSQLPMSIKTDILRQFFVDSGILWVGNDHMSSFV